MPPIFRLLFCVVTLIPACLCAQAPAQRVIQADIARVKCPTNRMYNFCVGAGRANEGLRADWQRQLRQVHDQCGFRYIRFHGLFCDDMGVYREDPKGNSIYNWQYVDELFDFLERIGMKPFVELGFMPSALASGLKTIFWYRANVTPPKDYAKWQAFITAFTRHITERYGAPEIRTWYFEVWNEPNLTDFWIGTTGGKSEADFAPTARAEYYHLYDTTVHAVKSVDPAYRVGGPASAGSAWIEETLNHCADTGVPLDFISTHSYATQSGYLDENGSAGTVFSPSRDAITREVKDVRDKIARSRLSRAELHYTEWSASYTPFDPIHDSYHSAAFILDKIKGVGGAAESMSYWTFTDIFEEAGPRMTPLHGGFGLLNYQDLPKPSFFAYQFLNRLGDQELRCDDPAAFVCRDGSGGVQALFWDFTITHPGPSMIDQVYYKAEHPSLPKGRAELRLSGLAKGAYQLAVFKVGYRANDLQSAYRDLGSPAQLTQEQVARLRLACSGTPETLTRVEIGDGGLFLRPFEMRENDVWFVALRPIYP
jgi:xylan 1,4-beta-xylosidase